MARNRFEQVDEAQPDAITLCLKDDESTTARNVSSGH